MWTSCGEVREIGRVGVKWIVLTQSPRTRWKASVHPKPEEAFQSREENQVARDQGEAEYEAGHLPVTWTHGKHAMSVLTTSGQRQRTRPSDLTHGLVQPLADLLKPIFPH